MAELNLWHWEKYVPTIGENATLEKPFYLRVKVGLTKAEFTNVMGKLSESKTADDVSAAFSVCFELGDEPLNVNGAPISSMLDYVKIAESQRNADLIAEMIWTLGNFNSVEGRRLTFSERLSGGSASTRSGAPKTANASSGSATNA